MKAIRWILLIFLLTLVAGGIVACSPLETTPQPEPCEGYDTLFRQYCLDVGEQVLGPVLVEKVMVDGLECMYSTNFLLCYERNAELPRVRLYPLSDRLFFGPEAEYLVKDNPSCGLDPRFRALDQWLDTIQVNKGDLLTCPIYDYDRGKITQYYQNIGYSLNIQDTQARAEILPLGQMVCAQYGECPKELEGASPAESLLPAYPCQDRFERLNFGDLTGLPVFGPASVGGCDHQVVFAGIAFCMSQDCTTFRALPLGEQFGLTSPLVPKNEQNAAYTRFIELREGLGHHVYFQVDDFISMHGGYEISGLPISEPFFPNGNDVSRQCFQNYCLDYNMTLPKGRNIKLVALGDVYASRDLPPNELKRPVFSRYNVNIYVGEQQPYIAVGERPVISLLVFNAQQQAIPDLNFQVTLQASDGTLLGQYDMPKTDQDGKSWISLDPVQGSRGDIITYKVCADIPSADALCVTDTFVIWP